MHGNGSNGSGPQGLSTTWLAARLGLQSANVDALRRSGELFGVPAGPGRGHVYPAWQFDRTGKPIALVRRMLAASRAAGLDERGLNELLHRRTGLTGGGRRLLDELKAGKDDHVLRSIATGGGARA